MADKAALPSNKDIVDYVNTHAGARISKKELIRAFNIKDDMRIAFKRKLKELEQQGQLAFKGSQNKRKLNDAVAHEKDTKKISSKAKNSLPSVFVMDIIRIDENGDLVARPSPAKTIDIELLDADIVLTNPRPQEGNQMASIGDRVLGKLLKSSNKADYTPARIIRILPKEEAMRFGILNEAGDHGKITPTDKKKGEEYIIQPRDMGKAKEGDLVSFKLEPQGRGYQPRVIVVDVLGNPKSEKAISLIALHEHGIPIQFPQDVIYEAQQATSPNISDREDWRHVPFVTIDPATAKDHDDAVAAHQDSDENNQGGWIVDVAIADVAHFVRPNKAMDQEALKRGNSVYFPDRVVPMLPHELSSDLCSLRPDEDRSTLIIRMQFNKEGHKLSHKLHRATIRSHARLSYQDAQKAIDGVAGIIEDTLFEQTLKPLWGAYEALTIARTKRAPLNLDLPERQILLNVFGEVDDVVIPERLATHKLIEEFMIQANVAAAELLLARKAPAIFRCHDTPALEKLETLREILDSVGMGLPKGNKIAPEQLNKILERVKGHDFADLVNESILRSQARAVYDPENLGHFGLNLTSYVHFTSPIRRYADLCIHRALISAYDLGDDGIKKEDTDQLNKISADISAFERRAMAAERDTIDRLIAAYLSESVGTTVPARISGVTSAGLFLRLDFTGADGFIPMRTLANDYFYFDEKNMRLVGEKTSYCYQMGDQVQARLVEVSAASGAIRLEMVKGGRKVKLSHKEKVALKGKGTRQENRRGGRSVQKPRRRRR